MSRETDIGGRADYSALVKPYEQRYSFSCGPASLKIALRAFGKEMDEGDISSKLFTTREGTDWKPMEDLAKSLGLGTIFMHNVDYDVLLTMQRIGYVSIIGWTPNFDAAETKGEGHFSVVRKAKPNHIFIADPANGLITGMSKHEFTRAWFDEEYRRGLLALSP